MLVTYMRLLHNNILEIKIAGSSCRPQKEVKISRSHAYKSKNMKVLTMRLNHKKHCEGMNVQVYLWLPFKTHRVERSRNFVTTSLRMRE